MSCQHIIIFLCIYLFFYRHISVSPSYYYSVCTDNQTISVYHRVFEFTTDDFIFHLPFDGLRYFSLKFRFILSTHSSIVIPINSGIFSVLKNGKAAVFSTGGTIPDVKAAAQTWFYLNNKLSVHQDGQTV